MENLTEAEIKKLNEISRELRCTSLRMIHRRQAGHPGGSLSAAEIVAMLYFKIMNIDPHNPNWEERDRFLLSKGHASALAYAALAKRGYFPESDLEHWGELDCHLQGHPDRLKTPGVDMNSGILGHGIAIGAGMALAAGQKGMGYHVYTLLGDGECQAGLVWEGANTAAKFHLSNLTAIVDHNGVQLDGFVQEIMPLEPLAEKWKAFGWHVIEADGHDIAQLFHALMEAKAMREKPSVILARTVKGKGVSFMENKAAWHGAAPNDEQLAQALKELGEEI
ncbi:MAG: transketolase [Chloroflexi bacterium]|nr:transketolase [Chloroflexota bacterium]